jgi:hypothetical protein
VGEGALVIRGRKNREARRGLREVIVVMMRYFSRRGVEK